MVNERDETDEIEWPAAPEDPIRVALLPLIEHILAVTADGSPERAAAMNMWRLRLSSVSERRSRRSRRSTDVLLNTKESK
jgi:hypothetical protein